MQGEVTETFWSSRKAAGRAGMRGREREGEASEGGEEGGVFAGLLGDEGETPFFWLSRKEAGRARKRGGEPEEEGTERRGGEAGGVELREGGETPVSLGMTGRGFCFPLLPRCGARVSLIWASPSLDLSSDVREEELRVWDVGIVRAGGEEVGGGEGEGSAREGTDWADPFALSALLACHHSLSSSPELASPTSASSPSSCPSVEATPPPRPPLSLLPPGLPFHPITTLPFPPFSAALPFPPLSATMLFPPFSSTKPFHPFSPIIPFPLPPSIIASDRSAPSSFPPFSPRIPFP